jgi:hypothetical protein
MSNPAGLPCRRFLALSWHSAVTGVLTPGHAVRSNDRAKARKAARKMKRDEICFGNLSVEDLILGLRSLGILSWAF